MPESVVGTEMASIEGSPLGRGYFEQAAKVYHGTLSYATWDGNPRAGGFFSAKRALSPGGLYWVTKARRVSRRRPARKHPHNTRPRI